jgi:hypothetical protein
MLTLEKQGWGYEVTSSSSSSRVLVVVNAGSEKGGLCGREGCVWRMAQSASILRVVRQPTDEPQHITAFTTVALRHVMFHQQHLRTLADV